MVDIPKHTFTLFASSYLYNKLHSHFREDGYRMRTFSWEYFTLTGDVDAYLLYKDMHHLNMDHIAEDEPLDEEDKQTSSYNI